MEDGRRLFDLILPQMKRKQMDEWEELYLMEEWIEKKSGSEVWRPAQRLRGVSSDSRMKKKPWSKEKCNVLPNGWEEFHDTRMKKKSRSEEKCDVMPNSWEEFHDARMKKKSGSEEKRDILQCCVIWRLE